MHYYQFNIGDYMKSTRHLSPIEDIAYRRLLDLYYDTEKPLDLDVDKLTRLIGLKDYKTETQQILSEFFNETKKGFIQKRVQRELDKYSAKAAAARENGKLGGRPKKTQPVNSANPDVTQPVNSANPDVTQPKAKQEPLTTNHKPLNKNHKPRTINQEPKGQEIISSKLDMAVESQVILNYLNDISGKSFKHVGSNLKLIKARLNEGHPEKDIYAVIDRKVTEWEDDPKMAKYIRPATLFNAEKFNQYVGELGVETPEDKDKRKIDEWMNGGATYEQ